LEPLSNGRSRQKLASRMTISELVERAWIVPIEIELGRGEQPLRRMFCTPQFIAWLADRAEAREPSPLRADLTPSEQLDFLIYSFLSGRTLIYGEHLKLIKAERHGVWEMKTPDLRIFGWFLERNAYVAVYGDWADRIKDFGLYRGYSIGVRRIRREMAADELCVRGVSPDDVISI
jgi:hypothetical protein